VKDVQIRAKRVMREVRCCPFLSSLSSVTDEPFFSSSALLARPQLMLYVKGNEKREREQRKKAEKEALEKARKEEEVREAKRTARKLNFLITQTEIFSHFVGSKIKSVSLLHPSSLSSS
jgi:response regulator RpfG family c-di-GMP phosphodiesterase